ncbi:MAG: PASTA domain-containing protein [Acetobacteraceae bacterium]|nr:PASTA domain-containing protein [Acetobacteraceae bacterium]
MVGRLLGKRYEVVEKIGGGGMAEVYRARCTYLNRPVAVKVLRPEFAGDEEFVQRFQREAEAAASLSHANIVSIYDVGREDGSYYIVMEYVPGQTLKELIRRRGRLDVALAVDIASQICDALRHAHGQGVIHRDIKPHNILLTPDLKVKVADFGIARAGSPSITQAGTVLGSVHYFSPEQARGGPTGAKSDIYSLGAVLYEMLTGRMPFEGETPIAVAMKHLDEPLVPPSRHEAGIPPAVEAVVLKAMAKSPRLRYQSAEEMLADLDAARACLAGAAPGRRVRVGRRARAPVGPGGFGGEAVEGGGGSMGQRKRSRWTLAAVLFVAAAVVGGGLYGVLWFRAWMNVPTVAVPEVVGLSLREAQARLEANGLAWAVVAERYEKDVPANQVVAQDPAPGEVVRQGRQVDLTVSLGPRLVEGGVPDVVGLNLTQARVILQDARLEVGRVVRKFDPLVAEDCVISQNPRAGTAVAEGTAVDLEVSQGPFPQEMPSLLGLTLEQARLQLSDLGLVEGVVTEREVPGMFPGTVLEQVPAPGEKVQVGAAVDLVVVAGAQPPPGTPPGQVPGSRRTVLTVSVPPGGVGTRLVEVELTDAMGQRVVYSGRHAPGERFPVAFYWAGVSARVRVLVDGQNVAEEVLR